MSVTYRSYRPEDLPILREITVESFGGVSIDQAIEQHFGLINGHDWQWRKARHIDQDARRDPEGIIVAEDGGQVIGYVTTWIDREAGIGNIPNLAVRATHRGRGIGRRLLELAIQRFRDHRVPMAKIETLAQNAVGGSLYPALGFREVARQVHFVMPLDDSGRQDSP